MDIVVRRWAPALTAQVLLLGAWAVAAHASARDAVATLPAGMDGSGWLEGATRSSLAMTALAGLSLLLVLAGRPAAAVLLPALTLLPAVLDPYRFTRLPSLLSFGTDPFLATDVRVAAVLSCAVCVAPAVYLARGPGRRALTSSCTVLGPRSLSGRLALPAAVAVVAAAFDFADPNGPGVSDWPVWAVSALTGALLTTGRLPRRFAWPAAVALTVLLTGSFAFPAVALATAGWVAAAPRAGAAWRTVLRPAPRSQPLPS